MVLPAARLVKDGSAIGGVIDLRVAIMDPSLLALLLLLLLVLMELLLSELLMPLLGVCGRLRLPRFRDVGLGSEIPELSIAVLRCSAVS